MKLFGKISAVIALLAASAFAQVTGQTCKSNGLYCEPITVTIIGSGTNPTATTVINGVTTPITGTLSFALNFYILEDDFDANGNPVCYRYDSAGNQLFDSHGNPLTKACPVEASYDITKWDITVGTTHLVHDPNNIFPPATNSGCGSGASNSAVLADGKLVYYVCGNNVDAASTGTFALIFPQALLNVESPAGNRVTMAPVDGSWNSGLYSSNGVTNTTPNGSTIGDLKRSPVNPDAVTNNAVVKRGK